MNTRDWSAVLNARPPFPDTLTVKGEVEVNSGGYTASLEKIVPQGINPNILLLELKLQPPSGASTDAFEWIEAVYTESIPDEESRFEEVEIHFEGNVLMGLNVEILH